MRKIFKIGIGITIVAVFLIYFGVGTYQQIQNEQHNKLQDAVISSDLSQEKIGNTEYALFVSDLPKVVWGAVTTTNIGDIPVTIRNVASSQISINPNYWYVDIIESGIDSNFELQANKIDSAGHMLDSPGLTEECGGPKSDVIRIGSISKTSNPTLCLEKVSDIITLEPEQSIVIYFRAIDNRNLSLKVDEQTIMSISTIDSKAYDINFEVHTQNIPS